MQIGKQLGRWKRASHYTYDTSESKDCRLNVIEKTRFMLGANPNLSKRLGHSQTMQELSVFPAEIIKMLALVGYITV